MKKLHRYLTFIVLPIIILLSGTGALLSIVPTIERFGAPVAKSQLSVAEVADLATRNIEGVERLRRSPNGQVIVEAYNQDGMQSLLLNTSTGELTQKPKSNSFFNFVKELHRSLFLEQWGKALAGATGVVMTLLCFTGILVLKSRAGGWRRLLSPQSGSASQKWHVEISRGFAPLLVLASVSATLMSAESFGLLDARNVSPNFPASVQTGIALPIADLPALRQINIGQLRELQLPFPNDPTDVYSIKTANGAGYIDQVSGELLNFTPPTTSAVLYEWIYLLHTGQGAWWLGLLIGLTSLMVMMLSFTGLFIWARNHLARPNLKNNVPLKDAEIVIGIGSEGRSTTGFAKTLHDALTQAELRVHSVDLDKITQEHLEVKKLIVLTSTYGSGNAPQNARRFADTLKNSNIKNDLEYAILGFGDSGFSDFCGYAKTIEKQLAQSAGLKILPLTKIDKQCIQSFAKWGEKLGNVLQIKLELDHKVAHPKTSELKLVSRIDYAVDSEEPVSVLRFESTGSKLPRFQAGDLVGVVKDKNAAPRLYSLASSSTDEFVEICVKRHRYGICSNFLHALKLGDTASVFFRENTGFRISTESAPTIMVSAGTGIAPLIGIARHNGARKPVHFYWGGRNPNSDFLYEHELRSCETDGRIKNCNIAFSRVQNGGYVQTSVQRDAVNIRALVTQGAQIMVCGGSDMASGLKQTLNQVLAPIGVSVEQLKREKRYIEDVY